MANDRTKGSVPNVRRAMREGAAGRRDRAAGIATRARGTVGTALKTQNRKRGLRGPGNQ